MLRCIMAVQSARTLGCFISKSKIVALALIVALILPVSSGNTDKKTSTGSTTTDTGAATATTMYLLHMSPHNFTVGHQGWNAH
jgi:hypothetical protein